MCQRETDDTAEPMSAEDRQREYDELYDFLHRIWRPVFRYTLPVAQLRAGLEVIGAARRALHSVGVRALFYSATAGEDGCPHDDKEMKGVNVDDIGTRVEQDAYDLGWQDWLDTHPVPPPGDDPLTDADIRSVAHALRVREQQRLASAAAAFMLPRVVAPNPPHVSDTGPLVHAQRLRRQLSSDAHARSATGVSTAAHSDTFVKCRSKGCSEKVPRGNLCPTHLSEKYGVSIGPSRYPHLQYGLYATRPFAVDDFVVPIEGETLSEEPEERKGYTVMLSSDCYVDASNVHGGGAARFINSPYNLKPEVKANVRLTSFTRNGNRVGRIVASRAIRTGEELFWSYGPGFALPGPTAGSRSAPAATSAAASTAASSSSRRTRQSPVSPLYGSDDEDHDP